MPRSTTAAYSICLRVRLDNRPGMLGQLATAIGEVGGNIIGLEGFEAKLEHLDEDVVVNCHSVEHQQEVVDAVKAIDGIELLDWYDRTFRMHEGGKIEVLTLGQIRDREDLSMAYTPGVARVCTAIEEQPELVHEYTIKKNTVAIVTDGTAVLGLGDIGPEAALLFKEFAGIDGFPICLNTKSAAETIETVQRLAPVFGGINLEDIAAPQCFEIEEALQDSLDIPIFHDDQHGTAVVVLAALENALKIVDKKMADLNVVIAGVGAAGVAIAKILLSAGVPNVIGVDRQGALFDGRGELNSSKQWFAENTNPEKKSGTLTQVMPGADVFIGVSGPGLITRDDVASMAADSIVFALANPEPEIRPDAVADLAAVVATGRSDFANQINNVLCFPGIFRGALDAGATRITEGMKVSAAHAIASVISETELRPDYIIPSVFDRRVAPLVAKAAADVAVRDGVTRGR